MCLGVPYKVLSVQGRENVKVKSNDKEKIVKSIIDVNEGDYVILTSGIIVEKLNKEEAEECLRCL